LRIYRFLFYLLLMIFLWAAISGGGIKTWQFGLPVAVAAAIISIKLLPPKGRLWRIKGLLLFIPFFIRHSIYGGVDVAKRALNPSLPIEPELLDYSMRLPEGSARIFMTTVINLLPGTLTAELKGGTLQVHTLDKKLPTKQSLIKLEANIARLYGYDIGK